MISQHAVWAEPIQTRSEASGVRKRSAVLSLVERAHLCSDLRLQPGGEMKGSFDHPPPPPACVCSMKS